MCKCPGSGHLNPKCKFLLFADRGHPWGGDCRCYSDALRLKTDKFEALAEVRCGVCGSDERAYLYGRAAIGHVPDLIFCTTLYYSQSLLINTVEVKIVHNCKDVNEGESKHFYQAA